MGLLIDFDNGAEYNTEVKSSRSSLELAARTVTSFYPFLVQGSKRIIFEGNTYVYLPLCCSRPGSRTG